MYSLTGIYPSRKVWLDGLILDPKPSQKVYNHSPDGFNWGYSGSGPAQLALAVVLQLTGKPNNYQHFKQEVIARLPIERDFEVDFELTAAGKAKRISIGCNM